MTLPDPKSVVSQAEAHDLADDAAAPNVAVAGPVDADAVERTDDGYSGETAGALGRLAAAVTVDADLAIHYPELDLTADGLWLVLAPLSGFVSTVSTGVGRATIDLDYDPAADPGLDRLDDLVAGLLDAARPRHDHYPVGDDELGVFTRGMTTFALDSLSVHDGLTASFDVSTTPTTRPSDVESRFAEAPGVESVEYESVVGVERAHPSPEFRNAIEAAHRDVRGDCEYDWLPAPGVFTEIPGGEKVALGTGQPNATEFGDDDFEACVDLLAATLAELEVVA